jgi:zinc/manganese transport system substrate-binding protein
LRRFFGVISATALEYRADAESGSLRRVDELPLLCYNVTNGNATRIFSAKPARLFPVGTGAVSMKSAVGLAAAFIMIMTTAASDGFAAANKIAVVAAENFYGDVAQQIGGEQVSVGSILSNPDQDPHLFEISPSIVRQIASAQIVVYNGADYDPWMAKLLNTTPQPGRVVIIAAELMHKTAGDNPHLWYDPQTMPAVAAALAADLAKVDPAHADVYSARLKTFTASLQPIERKIAAIRSKFGGVPVTASEPVFGYMAAALNLTMLNEDFQLAIMNNTEPSARDVAAFESDLRTHRARVMFYNKQASERVVQHLVNLAGASKVPVVGVTETAPAGLSYQDWMRSELEATEKALAGPVS